MARPQKAGLDYFPLDVDMDQDDKLFLIEAKHGLIGFAIVVRLFMLIYKEGYYRHYDEDREAFILAKRFSTDVNVINNVVNDCINEGLFNKNLYEKYGILTSRGIQRRFMEVCKRRKEVVFIREYFLLNPKDFENIVFEELTLVNVDNNPGKCNIVSAENPQSKVKESTVKKSTKESTGHVPFHKIIDSFNLHCPSLPPITQLTQKQKKSLLSRWRSLSSIEQWDVLFKRAEASDFLTGRSGKWNNCTFDWLIQEVNAVKLLRGAYDNSPNRRSSPATDVQYTHQHSITDLEKALARKKMIHLEGGDNP